MHRHITNTPYAEEKACFIESRMDMEAMKNCVNRIEREGNRAKKAKRE